jgi:alpha-L-fucosidase
VGAWMQANAQSIRGTTRTPLPVQAWGESTRRGTTLYLHVLEWPRGGRLVVGGLRAPVSRVSMLAGGRTLPFERLDDTDLEITIPAAAPDPTDTVLVVETAGELGADPRRLLSAEVDSDTLRAFDGQLEGRGLAFGAGKLRDAWARGWSDPQARVRWPVRLRAPATFEVQISYDADAASAGGEFAVKLGTQTLAGTVAKTPGAPVSLGKVSLPAGSFDLSVEATRIAGGELMRLRGLVLRPLR